MAFYRINKGKEENLPSAMSEGSLYFCIDTGNLFVDHKNTSNTLVRTKVSGKYAEKLRYVKDGSTIEINPDAIELNTNKVTVLDDTVTDIQYPSAKAVKDAISNASIVTVEITGAGTDSDPYASSMTFDEIKSAMQAGRTVVGIKSSSNPAFFIACISFSGLITFTRLAVISAMNDDVICESYTIFKDGHITHKSSRLEEIANKVTSLTADSTDVQYPSAKAVYDALDQKLNTDMGIAEAAVGDYISVNAIDENGVPTGYNTIKPPVRSISWLIENYPSLIQYKQAINAYQILFDLSGNYASIPTGHYIFDIEDQKYINIFFYYYDIEAGKPYFIGSTDLLEHISVVKKNDNSEYTIVTNRSIMHITYDGTTQTVDYFDSYVMKNNVLVKTNTTEYTPTGDYHPATKKYVDDSIGVVTDEEILNMLADHDIIDIAADNSGNILTDNNSNVLIY